jgi:hypothetical protein
MRAGLGSSSTYQREVKPPPGGSPFIRAICRGEEEAAGAVGMERDGAGRATAAVGMERASADAWEGGGRRIETREGRGARSPGGKEEGRGGGERQIL